jgi:hypothetical protein
MMDQWAAWSKEDKVYPKPAEKMFKKKYSVISSNGVTESRI